VGIEDHDDGHHHQGNPDDPAGRLDKDADRHAAHDHLFELGKTHHVDETGVEERDVKVDGQRGGHEKPVVPGDPFP
jgi:hypothetical protein